MKNFLILSAISVFVFVIDKIFYNFFDFKDKSYSLFVINNSQTYHKIEFLCFRLDNLMQLQRDRCLVPLYYRIATAFKKGWRYQNLKLFHLFRYVISIILKEDFVF